MRWSSTLRGLAAVGIVSGAGCTVGPDYHPTPPKAPAAWSLPSAGGLATGPADLGVWWRSFGDGTLTSLVERALQSNPDLKVAEARLRQARAIRDLTAAGLRPDLAATGSYEKERLSKNQPFLGALPLPPNFPFEYSVYQAGFDASWEIDLFGGKRRALEAATADWESAGEAGNAAQVSLAAEVARTYVTLRGAQRRREIARQNVKLQEQAVDLIRARLETGLGSELDASRAAALLAGVRAGLPALDTAVSQAMYGLAALLGQDPGSLVGELSAPAPIPPTPPEVPVGLPSDLLRRRPDVRQAERRLAAETARIGVAKSDWFPKVSLTGDAGMESVGFQKWFEPRSIFWSVGPTLQWQALDFGRVRAEVKAQTAVQDEALADYEKTVLTSLQEAENALVAYAQEQNRRQSLTEQVAQEKRSLDMADSLWAEGRVNFLDVLDARRSLYQAEDEGAASDTAISLDLVALYKAMGGGWER